MNEIRLSIPIRVEPGRVFSSLIEPDSLRVWFAEHVKVSTDEGRYDFWGRHTPENPEKKNGYHKITDMEEGYSFSYEWKLRGAYTKVEFMITAWDEGCVLHLRHSGLPESKPNQSSIGDFWTHVLEGLRSWLEHDRSYELMDYGDLPVGDVRLTVEIAAEPANVFNALTNPAQMDRWISQKAKIDLKPGGEIDYGWGGGPLKILEIDPGKKLSYSWQMSDQPETVTTWELDESRGGTRVTIVQSGFAPDRSSEDYYIGWHKFVYRLKAMLETGPDWEKAKLESGDF
jgi:uncharacterized protein YndB with AHSA1/START domain